MFFANASKLIESPGLRLDRYRAFLPEQEHPGWGWNPTPQHFGAVENVIEYKLFAPRIARFGVRFTF